MATPQGIMTSLEDQQALLLYRVGPVLCCSPSYTVLSIIQPVTLTHPPGSDAVRPGIFRHSGHVIKTEELRVRFGVGEADRKPGRMIIAELDSGRTAFWVDDIIDVISMPGKGWGQLSPQLPKGIFSRTLLLDDKIYLYAEFDALQKLQGHGLLKTYIEQLLDEKQKSATPTTTPVSSTSDKPKETLRTIIDTSENKKDSVAESVTAINDNQQQTQPAQNETPIYEPVSAQKKVPLSESTTKNINKGTDKPAIATQTTQQESALTPKRSSTPAVNKTTAVKKSTITSKQTAIENNKDKQQTINSPATRNEESDKKLVNETENNFSWPMFFLVLLLLAASGTGFYYYTSVEDPEKPSAQHRQINTEHTQQEYIATPKIETVEVMPVTKGQTDIEPVITVESVKSEASTNVTPSDYQAKIEQNDDGITIVIKAPKEESVLKHESIESTPPQVSEIPVPDTNETIPLVIKEEVVTTSPKPEREEILHIVAKGDTLWHIAKRYVNNPFRYPELARLSNIKNPDRIYPGNRVRIIREFN